MLAKPQPSLRERQCEHEPDGPCVGCKGPRDSSDYYCAACRDDEEGA
jgi:hypothetical protein